MNAMLMSLRALALSCVCVALAACPSDDDPAGDGGTDSAADDGGDDGPDPHADLSGEEIYTMFCAACHGTEGQGTDLGYELQHPVRDFSNWVVRNGRPGDEFESSVMSPYGPESLSDASLDKVWDWLDTFEQPTDGAALYDDYCANCHGADTTGGVVGVDISDKEVQDITEKVRQGIGLGDPGARMLYMPQYDATWLTDEEIGLIADFIAGV
jgi:mono/diheme cytochrome c family protein